MIRSCWLIDILLTPLLKLHTFGCNSQPSIVNRQKCCRQPSFHQNNNIPLLPTSLRTAEGPKHSVVPSHSFARPSNTHPPTHSTTMTPYPFPRPVTIIPDSRLLFTQLSASELATATPRTSGPVPGSGAQLEDTPEDVVVIRGEMMLSRFLHPETGAKVLLYCVDKVHRYPSVSFLALWSRASGKC